MRRASAVGCLLLLSACVRAPLVQREYRGHLVEGREIEPAAYAAFLHGAMAEAAGDLRPALAAYRNAAARDSASPEIWTRVGAVLCAIDPRDKGADDAFQRALTLDERYPGAWIAKARCAQARKDDVAVLAASRRAAELDPSADGARALLARAGSAVHDAGERDALISLTATARDRVAAWEALAAWGQSHGDATLWAKALEALVRIAPARRDSVARAAEELAGAGDFAEARSLAAAAVNAGEGPLSEERAPLAARLAVDEALERGDANVVRQEATRARVGLEEVAARALLAGRPDLARELGAALERADPSALGPRLVLAANSPGDVLETAAKIRRQGGQVSGATFVVFGVAAARGLSQEDARAALAAIAHDPFVAGDDRVVRPAVGLASRGAIDVAALPPNGQVELAVLRGDGPGEGLALPDLRALDLRHEYLALSVVEPRSPRAKELGDRLRAVAASDPIVLAASALVKLVVGPVDSQEARTLFLRNPADPLLAAAALRVAKMTGDSDVANRARAALTALAGRERRDGDDEKKSGATF